MAAVVALTGFWLLREIDRPGFRADVGAPADRFQIDYVNVGGAPAQTFIYQPQGTDTVFVWASRTPKRRGDMKKSLFFLAAVVIGIGAFAALTARGEDEAIQGLKGSASMFELKMRILEGSRDKPAQPAKPVTSSFLKYSVSSTSTSTRTFRPNSRSRSSIISRTSVW